MASMKKPAMPRKPAVKSKAKPAPLGTGPKAPRSGNATPAPMPKPKITAKPRPKPKAPGKKKIEMMPDKINPFKMTPAQKARYLKNPERYDY